MSEYIIYWDGIGSQLTDMLSEHVPPYLWPKRIRQERLREKIVRCRDCKYRYGCLHLVDNGDDDMRRCDASPDNFCSWGERRGE